jgi:Family of unknown function (DUF6252)
MKNLLPFFFFFVIFFTACNENRQHGTASIDQPPGMPGKYESRGSLSFKLNGELFEADPAQAKAWTTPQIPLAMLIAKNNKGLSVSMQIKNITDKGTYKLNSDSKGGASFIVNKKTYWIRSVMKDDYLNVVITGIKTLGPVLLLSGTFEGVLEDKDGNKVQITEGRFTTESL